MSMSAPMEPDLPARGDDGIPAADPGAGGPEPAEGFGVGGEEPDRPEGRRPSADDGGQHADPPFRTPDPDDISRRG
jgi:hypothetical protein